MTMSGGRDAAKWTSGTVIVVLLAIVLPRFFMNGEKSEATFTARDSAGVTVAESLGPVWEEEGGWVVGSEALLRLGVVDGDPHEQFDGITGGARLEGGGVVVADGGSQEVRFFDGAGSWTATAGGKGGGPGEFTGLSGLGATSGGRIWAYDFSLRRLTWMDASGEVTGITSLGPLPPMLHPVGALPDGTFILKQLWGAAAAAGATVEGLRRDPVAYVRFGDQGELVDTVGTFPGREIHVWEENGRGVMGTPPYGRNSVGAIWEGELVVGSQETFSLQVYTPEGEATRLIRLAVPTRELGAGDREAYIRSRMQSAAPGEEGRIRDQVEAMEMPPTHPAYGALLADRAGNLWVSRWAQYPDVAGAWTVLDSRGRWLGTVVMPPRFHPLDIGEEWILGVQRDEMDVEYVVAYPLEKPARSS